LTADAQVDSSVLGRSAYVEGELTDNVVTSSRFELYETYSVPGASPVFIAGTVDRLDATIGQLFIAGLAIDVTTLSVPGLAVGDTIALSGTQPVAGGLILAKSVLVINKSGDRTDVSTVRSISGSSQR
jgi:hypothetical protein